MCEDAKARRLHWHYLIGFEGFYFSEKRSLEKILQRTKVSEIRNFVRTVFSALNGGGILFFPSSIFFFWVLLNLLLFSLYVAGTKLKYKPGIIMGGRNLVHDCGVGRAVGYFLEPLIVLGLFGKKPLSITLKGICFLI